MCLHPGAIRTRVWRLLRCRGWTMIRFSGAFLLALSAAAVIGSAPALAQYVPPHGGYYEERLPPVIGGYYDDEDVLPRRTRPGQRGTRGRVLPYPDDEPELPPPTGLFGAPDQRMGGYGRQVIQQPQQLQPQQVPQGAP